MGFKSIMGKVGKMALGGAIGGIGGALAGKVGGGVGGAIASSAIRGAAGSIGDKVSSSGGGSVGGGAKMPSGPVDTSRYRTPPFVPDRGVKRLGTKRSSMASRSFGSR